MLRNKLFIMLILFLSAFSRVNASQLEVIPITNYYVHLNDQKSELKMFKDGDSGNVLFAMMPYEEAISFTLESIYIENYSKVDDEVKTAIQDMLFLGYGYKEHTDIKWYIISQYMLWECLGYNVDIKSGLGISVKEEYAEEFNEYLALINDFKIIPSYFSETIDINYNDKFLLNDLNDVEENFTLVPYAFLRIGKNGTKKLLYGTKPTQSKLVAVRKEQNNEYNKIFYSDEIDFINNVNVARKLFEVDVNIHGGKIKVINTDENNQPITGTKYNIYDSNDKLILALTTNEVGEAITGYIPYDDYYIKEISVDNKYIPINEKIKIDMIDYAVTELILKNSTVLDLETERNPSNEDLVEKTPDNEEIVEKNEPNYTETEIKEDIAVSDNNKVEESTDLINIQDSVQITVPNTKFELTKYILIIVSSLFLLGIKLYVK